MEDAISVHGDWKSIVQEAQALKSVGDWVGAEARLLEGIRAFPGELWLLFHYALIASEQWNWDRAVDRWSEFCKKFPGDATGAFLLSQALFRANRVEEAGNAVDEALRRFGTRKDLVSLLIDVRVMQGQWDAAIHLGNRRPPCDPKIETDYGPPQSDVKYPSYRIEKFVNVFSYWSGASFPTTATVGLWNHLWGPNYKVINDDIVIDLLSDTHPAFVELYRRIRIAACKADVARLVYLYRYGGLYLDMHCALGNYKHLETIQTLHEKNDAVFFANPEKSGYQVINSIILCKKEVRTVRKLLDTVINNLTRHFSEEHEGKSFVKYNVYCLSGPRVIGDLLYSNGIVDGSFSFMEENISTVKIARDPATDSFIPFHFYSYRKPGEHWSERQATERLFSH